MHPSGHLGLPQDRREGPRAAGAIRQHWTLHDPDVLAHLDPKPAPGPTSRPSGWSSASATSATSRQPVEQHYYLLSAPLTAQAFAAAVRSHWGIENQVHWVLDVAFREDACRARAGHAARNLAVVRHLALNLLRQDTTRKGSLVTKRFTAALDDTYLMTILAGVAPPPRREQELRCNRPEGISPQHYSP